jgi:DNA-binding winged helix-turn-helix (wHTH) protein/Tol biopolymer transport system component
MSVLSRQSAPRVRLFGPFAFEEASGELRKSGVRVRLQGQPLQILTALLRQPGSVMTREEFQQHLWNDSTFVDFDHGLNAAMNRLRQALGDSAEQPRYIETLPGRGYRFIAVVEEPEIKPVLVMKPLPDLKAPLPPQHRVRSTEKRPWLIGMIGAGVVTGLILLYLAALRLPTNSGIPTLRFSVSPPSGYVLEPGSSRQTFALSPDGSRLAFSGMNAGGIFQTFIRDLDALESRPLPNSLGSYNVFWAPDGRSLFLTVAGSLRRYSLGGDSYQVICDTPAIMLTGALMGSNLLISARSANFMVPASGGTPKALKELYPWSEILPDGRHVLYAAFDAQSRHHRARVVELDKPDSAKDLVETDSRVMYTPSVLNPGTGYLVYVRAGNLLAQPFDPRSLQVEGEPLPIAWRIYSFFPTGGADFSVSNNGMLAYRRYVSQSQLAWVNRRGDIVKRVGPENVNVKQGRLSPDGRKIAAPIFNVDRGVNEIWIIDTENGASRRAIVGRGLADNPIWSPDSNKLIFGGAYESPSKLFISGIAENDVAEQLPEGYSQVPTDWSRDGRFIAYTNATFVQVENEMRGDIWLIDMDRGRKMVHLIDTPFHEAEPAFSPDVRYLTFTSNESGRSEVYIQAFEAGESPHMVGERHVVSRQGAISLRWRRDGKELFYLAQDGRVYGVPITLAPKLEIGKPVPLFTISLEARAAIHSIQGFDVSTDGQQFLIPTITSSEKSEIVVIQNWEAEAERNRGRPGGLSRVIGGMPGSFQR